MAHVRVPTPVARRGDWNHALKGKEYAGSAGGRAAITSALDELGLVVPTAELPHRIDGLLSIDHIAVPKEIAGEPTRVVAAKGDKRLSDHDAYVVEVDRSTHHDP